MLPQFGPPEGRAADRPPDRYETGFAQTPVLNFVEGRCTSGCASLGPFWGTYGVTLSKALPVSSPTPEGEGIRRRFDETANNNPLCGTRNRSC
jgi:hypothetical protein